MSFNDLLADLDADVFAHLADDPVAIWARASVFSVALPAMLDRGEQSTTRDGFTSIEPVAVVRLSAADVSRLRPGQQPEPGDTLTLNGKLRVIKGEPWLDEEMNGRDWLAPVTDR